MLSIEANEDVRPYAERQMCVLPREGRMGWLDHALPEAKVLQPLAHVFAPDALEAEVEDVIVLTGVRNRHGPPAHRALADVEEERQRWIAVRDEAARRGALAA